MNTLFHAALLQERAGALAAAVANLETACAKPRPA